MRWKTVVYDYDWLCRDPCGIAGRFVEYDKTQGGSQQERNLVLLQAPVVSSEAPDSEQYLPRGIVVDPGFPHLTHNPLSQRILLYV
jgi:hypothetical protein